MSKIHQVHRAAICCCSLDTVPININLPVSNETSIWPQKIACDCRTLTNSPSKAFPTAALTHTTRLVEAIHLTKELSIVMAHLPQLMHQSPAKVYIINDE